MNFNHILIESGFALQDKKFNLNIIKLEKHFIKGMALENN